MVLLVRPLLLVKIIPHLHLVGNGFSVAQGKSTDQSNWSKQEELLVQVSSLTIAFRESDVVRNFWPSLTSAFFCDAFVLWEVFFLHDGKDGHLSTCLPVTMTASNCLIKPLSQKPPTKILTSVFTGEIRSKDRRFFSVTCLLLEVSFWNYRDWSWQKVILPKKKQIGWVIRNNRCLFHVALYFLVHVPLHFFSCQLKQIYRLVL